MLRKFSACLSIFLVFLFSGCASLRGRVLSSEEEALLYPVESYVPEEFDWKAVRILAKTGEGEGAEDSVVPGIWRFEFESADPKFPLIYHAVKIELSSAETESSDRFMLLTSRWERTSDFAAREDCLVAMNATPFDKTELAGIFKTGGQVLSEPVARYAALGLRYRKDGSVSLCRVFESQEDGELDDWDAAFGGFFVVLKDGEVRTDFIRRHTSRSGAGVSADGRILYLLVVEGERQGQSRGLSYPQCGEIFRAMGCSDALEFDGGGSSELCINGRSVMTYRVRRVQGNSFGLKK